MTRYGTNFWHRCTKKSLFLMFGTKKSIVIFKRKENS